MDVTVEPQDTKEVLAISRCRELLGDDAIDLTEAEIEEMRRHAHVLAHTLLEVFLQQQEPRQASPCRHLETA